MVKIDSTTSIKSFPQIYNNNNDELIGMINFLQDKISKIESENKELRKLININFNNLDTKYQNSLDKSIEEVIERIEKIETNKL